MSRERDRPSDFAIGCIEAVITILATPLLLAAAVAKALGFGRGRPQEGAPSTLQPDGPDPRRHTGSCRWWDAARGYGFITPDEGGKDVYAHYTGILGEGYRSLDDEQRVSYEIQRSEKGPRAVGIRKLS